jgi:signal transduction histidine kinase
MPKPDRRPDVERTLTAARAVMCAGCLVSAWVVAVSTDGRAGSVGVPLLFAYGAVAVAAVLLGFLAEAEKRRREQSRAIGELLVGIQEKDGFRAALRYGASALMRLTGSDAMLIAAREFDTNRAVLWTATRARSGSTLLTSRELPQNHHRLYFFHGTGEGWSIVRRTNGECLLTAIDRDGDVIPDAECDLDQRFWQFHQHQAALAIAMGFGANWRGRVYLVRERRYSLKELRFVHRALAQLVPAMHNQYLVRRLRSRAGTAERRRVARELHGGVIPSLVGLERHVAALRRQMGAHNPELEDQLQGIQRRLGDEAKAIRNVLQQIRPFEAGPGQFVAALAALVERFGRDAGIDARFYGHHDTYVPPRAARELARTLQEVLINVLRHSGASRVEVEFRADADAWRLDVVNNGRPFGFLGRLDLDELEARRLGPRVIKERIREMGGDLVIESSDSAGVRLEISLPRPEGQSKSA